MGENWWMWGLPIAVALAAVLGGRRYLRRSLRARLADPSLTEDEFTEIYAEVLRERAPDVSVAIVGPRALTVDMDGTEHKVFLDNLWDLCRADPRSSLDWIHRYIDALIIDCPLSADRPIDLDAVFPVIKPAGYLSQLPVTPSGGKPYFGEPFAGDLWVLYVEDLGGSLRFLTEDDGKELNLTPGIARERALANLKKAIPEIGCRGNGELFAWTAGGTFEASLMLADSLWERAAGMVQGEVVAAVPQRDILMFTGIGSPSALESLRKAAEALFRDTAYAISPNLFLRRGRKWEVLEAAGG